MAGSGPEVADVFRRYGDAYREQHDGSLSTAQRRVMTAIEICRTAAIGGHVEQCATCGHQRISYNSCIMGKFRNGELASSPVSIEDSFRQLHSPLRSALEQGDQFVWRSEDALPEMRRNDGLDCFQFLRGIAARVNFRCCQIGVSEPQRHLPDILRRLKDDHGFYGDKLG